MVKLFQRPSFTMRACRIYGTKQKKTYNKVRVWVSVEEVYDKVGQVRLIYVMLGQVLDVVDGTNEKHSRKTAEGPERLGGAKACKSRHCCLKTKNLPVIVNTL